MTCLYFVFTLFIQTIVCHSENDNATDARDVLKSIAGVNDEASKTDGSGSKSDWMDMFLGSHNNLFPSTSSAALMAQITSADRSPEEQINDIKKVAKKISHTVECEMVDLLTYALKDLQPIEKDGKTRKRRSVKSPVDSSQLVMKLLKHIKSNNDHQNIAIEKMMSAQEIAKKYNIPFEPDEGVLSDLVHAGEEQEIELNSILDSIDTKFTKPNAEPVESSTKHFEEYTSPKICNNTLGSQYLYGTVHPVYSEDILDITIPILDTVKGNPTPASSTNDYNRHTHNHRYSHIQPETQIPKPAFSRKPNFYDTFSYQQPQESYPYCSVEPSSPVVLSLEEQETEPNVVGEVYEETVTSKVFVDHEEPGVDTVNHIMTYTVSEKEHFRAPQFENMPQQMQYSFFLV